MAFFLPSFLSKIVAWDYAHSKAVLTGCCAIGAAMNVTVSSTNNAVIMQQFWMLTGELLMRAFTRLLPIIVPA